MNWLWARMLEPSTWAGMSGIFMALGMSEMLATNMATMLASVAGVVAVVIKEKGSM